MLSRGRGVVVGIIVGKNRTPVAFESRHLSESGAGLAGSHPAVRPDPDMLLGAVARGERGAFDLVYERFREPIHNQVFSVLRDLAQSEEVTQEVLLELWRTAVRYDQARGSATAWVLTIARRRAIDRVRSTAASAARDQRAAVSDATWDQAHETAEDPFDHERLLHCLDQLSALQREAIALAFYGGLTHCQVADTLGVPLGTVKARIRDALIKLRGGMISGEMG